MCKLIFESIGNHDLLRLKYLKTLAYVKFIDRKTALSGPEVDLIELANIIMDH